MSEHPDGYPSPTLRAAKLFAKNIVGDSIPNLYVFNSLALTTNSGLYTLQPNFTPEVWFVVATLTAGEVHVHRGQSRENTYIRLVNRWVKVPYQIDTITIETIGATGTFDVYAPSHLALFDIGS